MGFNERKQARIKARQQDNTTRYMYPFNCRAAQMTFELILRAKAEGEQVVTWLEPVAQAYCAMIETTVPIKIHKPNNPDQATLTCLNENCKFHQK